MTLVQFERTFEVYLDRPLGVSFALVLRIDDDTHVELACLRWVVFFTVIGGESKVDEADDGSGGFDS